MQLTRTSTLATIFYSFVTINCVLAQREVEISMEVTVRTFNSTLTYNVTPVPRSQATLGEGPHWDNATQSLYYVDIDNGKLFRYDSLENRVYSCKIQGETIATFVIPIQGRNGTFAVGCGSRVVLVTWDGIFRRCNVQRTLFTTKSACDNEEKVFNDGKCDARGRLFTGADSLYRYDRGIVDVVKENVQISNGLAWNKEAEKFYYIDSLDYEVKQYDYDLERGEISNPNVVLDLRITDERDISNYFPDGMTIDTEGNIYVAIFNAHRVIKYNPRTRRTLLEIILPCKRVSSCAFGGPNLDILYVTTATLGDGPDSPCSLFQVTGLGAQGLPATKVRV